MLRVRLLLAAAMGAAAAALPFLLPAAEPTPPATPIRSLSEFGPLDGPKAFATYEKAVTALREGTGGVLIVPADVWPQLKDIPLQGLVRIPPPPAETKQWRDSPGVAVVVAGGKNPTVQVPPLTGLELRRNLRLAEGDSAPHWGTHPVVRIQSDLVYGSVSFLEWLTEPTPKGENQRFYPATVRGLRPGQFLNIHGANGYGGGVTRAVVKALGFDAEKGKPYFVADTSIDHKAGAIAHNKSNVGLIHMTQTSNNDNQTYDVKVIRNQYAHGDTYVYYCDFNYMSNVHSAAGDENGHCYSAFIRSEENNFKAAVESVDWEQKQLKFTGGANVQTLGDSRPLINLNPKKQLTAGKVRIVPAECYHEPIDTGKCRFEGKTYSTKLVKNEATGVSGLKMGGLIRGDKDCPWTADVVGRYFALTEKTEMTPKGSLRWYEVTAFRANDDGTKEIEIRRFWWGAKSAGSPTLYRHDNYTWDGHDRPLDYVIAPGTYVNDVSRALPGGDRGGQSILGLAPYRDAGTPFDFEKGDRVEQAIGPDPFKPQVFRSWMWEDVPGAWPSAAFELANFGAASRFAAWWVRGGPTTLAELPKTAQQKPSWDNLIVSENAVGVGLNFKGDAADAGILFHQPGTETAIKWKYGKTEETPAKDAALTVTRQTGELTFVGGGVRPNGPVTAVAGLSGDATPAKNLRGKNVAVEAKATSLTVKFPVAEADGDYAVFIEQSWLSNRAITAKGPNGFTVTFEKAAPDGAKVDWMIVR